MKTIKYKSDNIVNQLSRIAQNVLSNSDEIVVSHEDGCAVYVHNTNAGNFVTSGTIEEINTYFGNEAADGILLDIQADVELDDLSLEWTIDGRIMKLINVAGQKTSQEDGNDIHVEIDDELNIKVVSTAINESYELKQEAIERIAEMCQ